MKRSNCFTSENLGRNTIFLDTNSEDVMEMNIIIARLRSLGIVTGESFSTSNDAPVDQQQRKDEYIAKKCIYNGKSVSEDAEQRLLDRLYTKHNIKRKSIDEKDFEAFLNEHTKMNTISGTQLSKMSASELESLFKQMKTPTQAQKEIAWKKMDTGVYDEEGNLIGDKDECTY